MAAKHLFWLTLTGLAMTLSPAGPASAGEPATAPGGEQKAGGFADILELISKPTFPSLSGLIRPEKMGVLTDNTCQIRDNQIEPELMSGNKTEVLSGIRILSGISVDVRVTIRSDDDDRGSKVKARKTDDKRPAKKPKKNKTRSRHNEPKPQPK
jgi:hypothetical protein